MHASKRLTRHYRLILLAIYTASVIVAGPTIERLGISGLWYMQDRADVTNYSYGNARAELADPTNVTWVDARTGYTASSSQVDALADNEIARKLAGTQLAASESRLASERLRLK